MNNFDHYEWGIQFSVENHDTRILTLDSVGKSFTEESAKAGIASFPAAFEARVIYREVNSWETL